MRDFQVSTKRNQAPRCLQSVRFHPAVHLNTGDLVGAFAETPFAFEDRPRFGMTMSKPIIADWVSNALMELCRTVTAEDIRERPIIMSLPAAALGDRDVVSACVDVMAGSRLCPQEICFEITDAALVASSCDVTGYFRSFRQRGFRIAIDARTSWQCEIPTSTWLMVDTLRVRFDRNEMSVELAARLDIARAAGVAIVAEKARWRDGEQLSEMGIEYALHPRADA